MQTSASPQTSYKVEINQPTRKIVVTGKEVDEKVSALLKRVVENPMSWSKEMGDLYLDGVKRGLELAGFPVTESKVVKDE